MSDHDEIQSEEKKPPLSYKVKTGGFTRAGLVKTESITRESPVGRHLHQVIPVSYTHLDVYKRQHIWCLGSLGVMVKEFS